MKELKDLDPVKAKQVVDHILDVLKPVYEDQIKLIQDKLELSEKDSRGMFTGFMLGYFTSFMDNKQLIAFIDHLKENLKDE